MAQTVRLAQGQIRGGADKGAHAFLGVPYASAPFGALRLRPPAPPASWEGVRDATSFGPTAPKGSYPPPFVPLFPETDIPGEECLNLNVWTPDPGGSGLPVMVWIHGGSFTNGSGSVPEYNGAAFARDGVVCVTINYRLGAEGFLYTPDGTPNPGLLDQIAALEWVRDNIHAFGGDPDRVTVAGESAGAMSVTTLLSMPRAAGLFHRAIAQSGAGHHTMSTEEGGLVARYIAEALGVPARREAIAAVPVDAVTKAAEAITTEVQTAGDAEKWGPHLALSTLPFMPTVDGDVVPRQPLESLAAGQGADVQVLIGSNLEEAKLLLAAPGTLELIDEPTLLAAVAGYGLPAEPTIAAYRANRPGAGPGELLAAVVTDWFYRIPAIRVAEARAQLPGGTWMYEFTWRSTADHGRLGSGHGTELPFVFDNLDADGIAARLGTAPPQAVADTVHGTWVRFAADGDPGWAPYDTDTRTTGILDRERHPENDPAGDERALWQGHR